MNTLLHTNALRVTYNQACEMLGLKSRESLRRLIKQDSSFPRPIKMGVSQRGAVYFDRKELCEWHEAKKTKS